MPIVNEKNSYMIPRGRVTFNPLNAAGAYTGEIPFGNCPGVGFSTETEKAEHFSSEAGLAEKDASIIVRITRTGTLTCDNFSGANLALFVAGEKTTHAQAAATIADEVHTVMAGRLYQLGATSSNPAGARNITDVTVTTPDGLTTYAAGTDYNIDLGLGRLQIMAGGAIAAAATAAAPTNGGVAAVNIWVGYKTAAKQWEQIRSGASAEVRGALRVVSDVASGENRDWYFPDVTLTPSGELPLVQEGTEFVTMEFGIEILKPANAQAMYIDGRPQAI